MSKYKKAEKINFKSKKGGFTFDYDPTFENHLYNFLDTLDKTEIEVGIVSGKKKTEQLAMKHEFGSGNVPQRSFLRRGWDEAGRIVMIEALRELKRKFFKDLEGKRRAIGNISEAHFFSQYQMIKILGKHLHNFVNFIQDRVLMGIMPKLKDFTIMLKREKRYPLPTTALIATGNMIMKSLGYRIKVGKKWIKKIVKR